MATKASEHVEKSCSKTASKAEKTAAASALTQVGNKKVTSKKAALNVV